MEKEKRESFLFYASFWEAIKEVPREIQGDVLTAIIEYGLYGETTENLKPIAKAMFTLIKPQIDANYKRYKNGKKGGTPVSTNNQSTTKVQPKYNQNTTKVQPNENVNVNVNYNENENVNMPPTLFDFLAERQLAYNNLSNEMKAKLKGLGVEEPIIRTTNMLNKPYIDAVQVLIDFYEKDGFNYAERMSRNLNITDDERRNYIREFLKEQYVLGNETYDYAGLRQHCVNWIRRVKLKR